MSRDGKIIGIFGAVLAGATLLGYTLGAGNAGQGPFVGSIWQENKLKFRDIAPNAALLTKKMGPSALIEQVEATGMLLPGPLAALSLAPGRDGLRLQVGREYAYFTPTDLLSVQAYDRGQGTDIGLTFGVDFTKVNELAKARLGDKLPAHPHYERVRYSAPVWAESAKAPPVELTVGKLRARSFAAAEYLARITRADGTFRYEVRATTTEDAKDYNWVRHAGTSFFLARAARVSRSPGLRLAAERSLNALRTRAYQTCGPYSCIGTGENDAELGASALGLLAFLEFDRGFDGADGPPRHTFSEETTRLAGFLLAAQKPNGDFNHTYDRQGAAFVDRYRMYYTGEAAFALARYGTLNAAADAPAATAAASRALSYISDTSWSFPGNRYYVSEEHWTCQVLEELWDKQPSETGLRFCLRWAEVIRSQRIREGQGPAEDVGASRVVPVMAPRLTPVASRAEALASILAVLHRSDRMPQERSLLEEDVRASLSVVAQQQLGFAQPTSVLLANAALLHGGFPASRTLWDVRVDSVQHAGNAFLNFAAEEENVAFATK